MRIKYIPALFLLPVSALFAAATSPSSALDATSAANAVGMTDMHSGDLKSAESHFREAVSLAGAALGESHPDTALYETNLARALLLEGQPGRAEVLLHRARYIIESASSPDPALLAVILAELASVEADENEFTRAEADALHSAALVSSIAPPDSLDVAVERVMLATIYLRERKLDEAERVLPAVVALERRLTVGSANSHRRELAFAIRRLGQLRALQHHWNEAQALYSEAIDIFESTAGPRHPALAPILFEYAAVLRHSGATPAAVRAVEARAKAIRA